MTLKDELEKEFENRALNLSSMCPDVEVIELEGYRLHLKRSNPFLLAILATSRFSATPLREDYLTVFEQWHTVEAIARDRQRNADVQRARFEALQSGRFVPAEAERQQQGLLAPHMVIPAGLIALILLVSLVLWWCLVV